MAGITGGRRAQAPLPQDVGDVLLISFSRTGKGAQEEEGIGGGGWLTARLTARNSSM